MSMHDLWTCGDVIEDICEMLPSADLASLALVNRYINSIASRRLYREVVIAPYDASRVACVACGDLDEDKPSERGMSSSRTSAVDLAANTYRGLVRHASAIRTLWIRCGRTLTIEGFLRDPRQTHCEMCAPSHRLSAVASAIGFMTKLIDLVIDDPDRTVEGLRSLQLPPSLGSLKIPAEVLAGRSDVYLPQLVILILDDITLAQLPVQLPNYSCLQSLTLNFAEPVTTELFGLTMGMGLTLPLLQHLKLSSCPGSVMAMFKPRSLPSVRILEAFNCEQVQHVLAAVGDQLGYITLDPVAVGVATLFFETTVGQLQFVECFVEHCAQFPQSFVEAIARHGPSLESLVLRGVQAGRSTKMPTHLWRLLAAECSVLRQLALYFESHSGYLRQQMLGLLQFNYPRLPSLQVLHVLGVMTEANVADLLYAYHAAYLQETRTFSALDEVPCFREIRTLDSRYIAQILPGVRSDGHAETERILLESSVLESPTALLH